MRNALALSALIFALSGCSSDGSPTEPDVNLLSGSMSARIDGAAWQATAALSVSFTGGILGTHAVTGAFDVKF